MFHSLYVLSPFLSLIRDGINATFFLFHYASLFCLPCDLPDLSRNHFNELQSGYAACWSAARSITFRFLLMHYRTHCHFSRLVICPAIFIITHALIQLIFPTFVGEWVRKKRVLRITRIYQWYCIIGRPNFPHHPYRLFHVLFVKLLIKIDGWIVWLLEVSLQGCFISRV